MASNDESSLLSLLQRPDIQKAIRSYFQLQVVTDTLELSLFKKEPEILGYLADDKLSEISFSVHLQRVISLLSDSVIISDPHVEFKLTYLIQMLWGLFQKSSQSLKQRMAHLVADKPLLTTIALKAMCTYLESCDSLSRRKQQLHIYTHFIHLICAFIPFESKIEANIHGSDQIRRLVKIVEQLGIQTPIKIADETGIVATMLMLYLSANMLTVRQLLKENECIQSIGQLIQFSSTDIKLISKALIARLIPMDTANDDMAVLMLITHDEVDRLIGIVQSKCITFPIMSVIMDLSRSPHNMRVFASKDFVTVLSNIMDSFSDEDQARSTQVMQMLMQQSFTGNEDKAAIANNGTLMSSNENQPPCGQDHYNESVDNFLSYIISCTKSLEDNTYPSTVVENLFVAIFLVYRLMDMFGQTFRKEITMDVLNSPGAYEAIRALTKLFCFVHNRDVMKMKNMASCDFVLQCILWWTSNSEVVSIEVSKTGLTTHIRGLLRAYIQSNAVQNIHLCIKIFLNCASNPATLPAFNSSYSCSDMIVLVQPLIHGEYPDIALHSKMLLALLNPLLDSDNLHALKLTNREAKSCILLLKDANTAPYHLAQDVHLLTVLRAVTFFSHEYHRQNKSKKDDKKKGIKKISEYEMSLSTVSDELKSNIELFIEEGILPVLNSLLDPKFDKEVQAATMRLLWCLSHSPAVRKQMMENADMIAILRDMQAHPSSELSQPSHCILWLLGVQSTDGHSLLQYAKGCLKFMNYSECIEICDKIMNIPQDDVIDPVTVQARLIKVNNKIRATQEGNSILNECLRGMREAITLLGKALDENILDEEGSKLLDWAMIDCLSINDQLDSCKRCLLCRCKGSLKKSHVWPKFVLKDLEELPEEKEYVFGTNKQMLKSSGGCTYRMLCERCEELLSQNGENDFKKGFPVSGEIMYSTWLYNFCCGLIFRCLCLTVWFPMHFNDDEVYRVLLLCRKQLLSLPVIVQKKAISLNDCGNRQLEKLKDQLKGTELDVFVFISPLNSQQDFDGVLQMPYPQASIGVSRTWKLDKPGQIFNGYYHFLLLCCGPISLIVSFDQSNCSLLNRGFHLSSNPEKSDKIYSIPSPEECVNLLPEGVWAVIEELAESSVDNYNYLSRLLSDNAKLPPCRQSVQSQSVMNVPSIVQNPNTVFQISFLPKEFDIVGAHKSVKLPHNHKILVHAELPVPVRHDLMTYLLCMDESKPISDCLYVLMVTQNDKNHTMFSDGATVVLKDNKLIMTGYLLQRKEYDGFRSSMSIMQLLLNKVLPNKHFDNIDLLMYLMNSRRYIKGPLAQILPSLDQKCSPEGCWYCRDVCHNCMQPSSTFYSGISEDDHIVKFCSEKCKDHWFYAPDQKPFHVLSFVDDTSLSKKPIALAEPLLTIISGSKNCLEQVYLSVGKDSNNFTVPFIVWHIRRLKSQFFAQFYTTKDLLPLNNVWIKHFCTANSEQIAYKIASERNEVQSHLQSLFGLAAQKENYENFESFMDHMWSKHGVSSHYSISTVTLDQKPALQSFLPPSFRMVHPDVKIPFRVPPGYTSLLHYTEVANSVQTIYVLVADNLFSSNSLDTVQMCIITVKRHMVEGWCFADGTLLSACCTKAIEFLHYAPYTNRSQSIEDMSSSVERILPKMLRENGIPSISTLLSLAKYTWINPLVVNLDLRCSSSAACWYCKPICIRCSFFFWNPGNNLEYCEECRSIVKLDPSTIPPIVLNPADLAAQILNSKALPVIAAVTKVIFIDETNEYTILRIYLSKSNSSLKVIPPGKLFAFCQLRTTKTQVVIDCLLSEDYVPLEPVWFSDYCERMIEKYRSLLHHEITLMVQSSNL